MPRAGLLLAVALGLSACGGGEDTAAAGGEGRLAGESFVVGAKDFAEQNILAEMTALMLEAEGADAEAKEVKGSANTRAALESGDVDMYWEYTGTGWIGYLQETVPLTEPAEQYEAVAAADLEKNDIHWFPPADFNNTYALAVNQENAEKFGLEKLSDVAAFAKSNPDEATICIESEFGAREDGLPGLLKAYGIDIPSANIKTLDTGVIYSETGKGDTCTLGEVFQTDGRIQALDLVVLEDDKNFFPVYQGALTAREETVSANPALEEIMAPLIELLDTETMQELNARVDVDGEFPADVAEDFLTEQGLL